MPNSRSFLFFALLIVGFLIWQAWQQDYAAKPAIAPVASSVPTAASGSTVAPAASGGQDIPKPVNATATSAPAVALPSNKTEATPGQRVDVKTDLLHVVIDSRGASIIQADLLAYPLDPSNKEVPFRLLSDSADSFFVAQSGLVSGSAPAPDHNALFSVEQTSYVLAAGQDALEVPLTWQDASGVKVRKVYTFHRGSYLLDARDDITNSAAQAWSGAEYRQLQRVPPVIAGSGFAFSNPERYAFAGAAWYSPQGKFEKLPFAKFPEKPLSLSVTDGWAAMLQHYFFAAWIPASGEADQFSTSVVSDAGAPRYLIRAISPAISVAPNETKSIASHLYVGPKLVSQLSAISDAKIATNLDLTADYGMLTIIAQPLHWILLKLYTVVGNWGFAIILLVLLIKLALFKLSEAQFRSMAKMKKLQPRMAALKERYGDDKTKLNAATMELYQKEKINPLGGCLPTLVQIPIFFALYWVLLESVELRQAPFIGWIHNLTAPDPYFILPAMNAAVMIATQWISPTTGMDPVQARMMKIMPIAFSVMFAFFPAGLVLYYVVNSGLSLLQQWVITKRLQTPEKAKA